MRSGKGTMDGSCLTSFFLASWKKKSFCCAVYYYVVIYRNKYTHQTKAECRTQENKCKRIYTKSFFFIITTTQPTRRRQQGSAAVLLCMLLFCWCDDEKLESRVCKDLYQKKDKIRSCKNNFFFCDAAVDVCVLVMIIFFQTCTSRNQKALQPTERVGYRDV